MSTRSGQSPAGGLSQADMDEADELFVSLSFGSAQEKTEAGVALEQWAGNNPARLDYVRMQQAADQVVDHHLDELRNRYPRHPHTVAPRSGVLAVQWLRSAYLSTGLMLGLAAAVVYVNPVLSSQQLETSVGEQVTVALGDGSSVLLNTNSTAVFDNRLRSRELTLNRGEVSLTVAHSSWRPFQVAAQAAVIRDIGTVFSVRSDTGKVAVAVVEGEVEISAATDRPPVRVQARQAAMVYGDQVSRVFEGAAYDALVSWRDRRLEFASAPLSSLVQEVQRYRTRPIVIADRKAEMVRVTGGFSSTDPDLLLRTLPAVAPVNVQFAQNGDVVISSR